MVIYGTIVNFDDGVKDREKEPLVIRGHHPDELDAFRAAHSFKRVQKNSRWRYSRPRAVVENEFNRWYRK